MFPNCFQWAYLIIAPLFKHFNTLYVDWGVSWNSTHSRRVFSNEMQQKRLEIGFSRYRHLAIRFMRTWLKRVKNCKAEAICIDDYQEEDFGCNGTGIQDLAEHFEQQAGHGLNISDRVYARMKTDHSHLTENSSLGFKTCSQEWQRLLEHFARFSTNSPENIYRNDLDFTLDNSNLRSQLAGSRNVQHFCRNDFFNDKDCWKEHKVHQEEEVRAFERFAPKLSILLKWSFNTMMTSIDRNLSSKFLSIKRYCKGFEKRSPNNIVRSLSLASGAIEGDGSLNTDLEQLGELQTYLGAFLKKPGLALFKSLTQKERWSKPFLARKTFC